MRKCSLTPLRGRPGVEFVNYHPERRVDAAGHVLLHTEGEELGARDAGRPILVLDCSWRRVEKLLATVDGDPVRRRLGSFTTAYPRKSTTFADPSTGLASIEALYAATVILGEPDPSLLDRYRWSEEFLTRNPVLASSVEGPAPGSS